jgi:C-terminal processing protease CtpA/Prc
MTDAPAVLDQLDRQMSGFADTTGLIIDVRGNGGGTQDVLRQLLPYFMRPDEPVKIVNVAAYRLPVLPPEPSPEGYLPRYRGLHPVTSKIWSADEAQVIERFLAAWKPAWKLPARKFSDWHVMGVRHASNPKAFFYDRPVVVLADEGAVSATDNFLGAMKGHRNVTLMGRKSAGASGRMQSYTLPGSGISFVMSQMASFAAAGYTYDGNGVAPDVFFPLRPEDTLRERGDSLLDAAIARLRRARPARQLRAQVQPTP